MKKVLFPILAVVLALSLALPMAAVVGAAPDTVDFETFGGSFPPGTSVEGLGTVHPDLNISSTTEDIVLIKTGDGTAWGYNTTPSGIVNGCLDDSYGIADGDDDVDEGFEMTFGGKTVSSFSILMLDYGDYFPHSTASSMTHTVKLVAYDSTPTMVAEDVLTFTSSGAKSTERTCTSHTWAFGGTDLEVAGDACPSDSGRSIGDSPGRWQFTVSGTGIAKVTIEFVGDQSVDSGVGWDNLSFEIEANPAINIEKSTRGGMTRAHEGDSIIYIYTVTNTGNVPLSSVAVTDPDVDRGPAYVSGDDGDGVLQTTETWIYRAAYVVPYFFVGPVTNTGTASGWYEATEVSDTDDWSVAIVHNPAIEVTKSADPTSAQEDDLITYAITVENTGDCDLTEFSVTDDTATSGPTYVSGDDSDGILQVGETWTYTASVLALADDFQNEASATFKDALGGEATDSDTADVDVVHPSITLTKSAEFPGDRAGLGETIDYTFAVYNDGDVDLTDVEVDDDMFDPNPVYSHGDDSDDILQPGETWYFTASHVVTELDIADCMLENTATATALYDSVEYTAEASALVPVAKIVNLIAGQHIDVGGVEIWNDGTILHVTYSTEDGWVLTETHLYVGKNEPPTNAPGQFPYDGSDAVFTDTEVTFEIPLTGIDSYSMKTNKKGKIVGPMSADGAPGVGPGQKIYVAAHSVVQKTTVITAAPYYATAVTSVDQALRKNGSPVDSVRSNPDSILQYEGYPSAAAHFFSLGFGGEVVVEFGCPIRNGDGDDLRIIEDTWGNYPAEKANVYASQDGDDWTFLGEADNVGRETGDNQHTFTYFDLGDLAWASYIKVVDTTDSGLFESRPTADGYDLNAVESLQDCIEIQEETAWGGWGDTFENIIDFDEPNWSNYLWYNVMNCDD